MAVQVLLPKLGLTMESGVIDEWLIEPGTRVNVGDPLLRLQTDKVDADVEAEAAGVFHPAVPAGSDLPPGTLIGWLLEDGEDLPAAGPATAAAPPPAPLEEPPVVAEPGALTPPAANGGRRFVSPNARRIAKERGVDINAVTGTGPGGRIVTADVLAAATAPAGASAPSVSSPLVRRAAASAGVDLASIAATGPGGRVLRADVAAAARREPAVPAAAVGGAGVAGQVIPLTGMRGVIASRMHASLHEMAQLTLGLDATMDAAIALRTQLKQQWGEAGLPVPTITDFVVKAAALALGEHPRMNAGIRDDAIHLAEEINVGVAVALEDGLMVPVVKGVDRLGLAGVAAETKRLAQAARTGQLKLPDLEAGTFTVSTLGSYGIDFFTPVITPGQVGILGVGRLRDSVRWDGDTPVRTQVLTLSITFDHRAIDGAPAADFVRSVANRLAHPLTLLA